MAAAVMSTASGGLRVACIVPTRNGEGDLRRLLESWAQQSVRGELLVVDSSSTDGTVDVAREFGAAVTVIDVANFNHGGTRQMMVDRHPDFDVYVFVTQDACLQCSDSLARLIAPFEDPEIGAVCGRQLPHQGATDFAVHARLFNYGDRSRVVGPNDVPTLGIKSAFMSNSFAAYRAKALKAVGGFPSHVILAEDMYVAARMLLAGWKVAYASDAFCRHSHDYSIAEEFKRYFDIGVYHAREPWIRERFGGAGGEGLRFVRSELGFLGAGRLHKWPGAVLRNAGKLVAYRLGRCEAYIPLAWKRRLSMHRTFWDGPFATLATGSGAGR